MIKRIKLLKNVGQFDSVNPDLRSALDKLTLVYGENGSGKTTIAVILRSLGTNNAALITDRKRLLDQGEPHVVIETNDKQFYSFENGKWLITFADIAIFDDHFVEQNVCSGLAVGTEHKKTSMTLY